MEESALRMTASRTGVSALTSAGVYATDEPAGDHLGLPLLPDPPTLSDRHHCSQTWSRTATSTTCNYSCCSRRHSDHSCHGMQGRPLQRSLNDGPLLVLCI